MSADIFVDRTGRRRRVLRWLAVAAAAVLVGSLGLLAAGLFTGAPLPLRGWTERGGVPGPESAVIGPAATPAGPPAASGQPTGPSTAPAVRSTAPPAARPTAATSARPGQGNGRDNRPTAKPSHAQPKAG